VTPGGRRVVSASRDKTFRVWDLETGYSRVFLASGLRAVAVTPDGRRAVSALDDGTLRVWDLETGYSHFLKGHSESVYAVAVTADGRRAGVNPKTETQS
jgi:WD40 repeat protein